MKTMEVHLHNKHRVSQYIPHSAAKPSRLLKLLAGLILFAGSALAQDKLSSTDRSNDLEWESKIAPTGIRYGEPILFQVRDTSFKVPAAYLPFWLTPEEAGMVRKTGLDVMFWMPDLRPIETKPVPPMPRPREEGRPPADLSEFGVEVKTIEFVTLDDPDFISPDRKFLNDVSASSGPGDRFWEEHGLEAYSLGNDRIGARSYHSFQGAEPQIILTCLPDPSKWPNPLCWGYVYFKNEKLSFFVSFEQYKLEKWLDVANSVKLLALRWRMPP